MSGTLSSLTERNDHRPAGASIQRTLQRELERLNRQGDGAAPARYWRLAAMLAGQQGPASDLPALGDCRPRLLAFVTGATARAVSLVRRLLNVHPRVAMAAGVASVDRWRRGEAEHVVESMLLSAWCCLLDDADVLQKDWRKVILAGDAWLPSCPAQWRGLQGAVRSLTRALPVPFCLVHVVERPSSVIADWSPQAPLETAHAGYAMYASAIEELDSTYPSLLRHVYADDLMQSPRASSYRMFRDLGVTEISASALDACARVREDMKRDRGDWLAEPTSLDRALAQSLAAVRFLDRYRR